MITCELTYLPFNTTKVNEEMERVISSLDDFEIECEVFDLSTTVRGECDEVFRMIQEIFDREDEAGKYFRLHIELLNTNVYS